VEVRDREELLGNVMLVFGSWHALFGCPLANCGVG